MKRIWNSRLVTAAAVIGVLALSAACTNSDNVLNPPGGGGGAADVEVLSSTLAFGNTNISGADSPTITSGFENAGADTRVQVDATTADGYKRQVLVYFTTATGAVWHVTYSWGLATASENILTCDSTATACTGASVDTGAKVISLAGVPLDNTGASGPGSPPTESATLGQNPPASMIQYPNP